jgi:hypothetical protein
MEVQEAVAQPETGLYQGGPGLATADTVDPQTTPVLESLNGGGRAGPEESLAVGQTG